MKINIEHEACSGCTACVNICPHNAITLQKNKKGFQYPVIDSDKCTDCGLCGTVCQCMETELKQSEMLRTFAVRYPDDSVRSSSQSGGLFYGLAERVIGQGGVCYGAAVEDDLTVKQIRVSTISDLKRLQGSKYVQSDVQCSFAEVEKDLCAGNVVLYSGTSCIIDGLYRYIRFKKLDDSKLYTCDLVCHGVMTPLMYEEHLKQIENKEQKKITAINFRDKKFGWHTIIGTYRFEDNTTESDAYYNELYFSNIALRNCCYQCQYTDLRKKQADITMADFWGIENILPDWGNDNKGISLAAIRSEKGLDLLQETSLDIREVSPEAVLDKNHKRATRKPQIYDRFWKDYFRKGYEYSLKKYTVYGGIPFKVKRKIMMFIHKW